MKNALVSVVAFAFLVAFVAVWAWIAHDLYYFEPPDDEAVLEPRENVVEVAGFLAATVGAGTAAFLGIEIKQRPGMGFRAWFSQKTARAVLLAAGVLAYLAIGGIVFTLWITESNPTPDFIATFSWGILGWAAGAFTAAFAAQD
ncbi:MAG TPA: hypothetical protein VH968_13770 [Gaiellaceae bacterium]|jgi:hypothetical protein